MNWYQKSAQETLEEQKVKQDFGLKSSQAKDRLVTFGPNVIAESKQETLLDIFIRQFKSPLIYILVLAAILVIFLGQKTDAIVILAVIILNAVVGTVQEGRARNSLSRLRALTRHKALVRRDSEELLIPSEEVVVGDILILHEGDRVAADARIIKAEGITADEAVLTGEAFTIAKTSKVINKKGLVVGDQKNMLFTGTSTASGYAEAVVVATGIDSELGKISKGLQETANVPLPLAQKVNKLSHFIAIAVFGIASLVLLVGLVRGISAIEIITATIGMTVSIVPEGLPVAVTIVLARGVWRMAKNKAIVRQMAAVEAMGNADTLLVDKTGTITTGKMVIRKIFFEGKNLEVEGKGYVPTGEIKDKEKILENRNFKKLLSLAYLSLKADIVHDEHLGWKPTGDPTEAAIAVLSRKFGLERDALLKKFKPDIVKPFDAQKRYIEAQFTEGAANYHVFIGAPEFLIQELKINHLLGTKYEELAKKGLRVVGIAIFDKKKKKIFASALLAIEEEIRDKVSESIKVAKEAGFRVVMMTGDHAETGRAIAEKTGIFKEGDTVMTGAEVEKLSEVELEEKIESVSVFARITPEHKLAIAKAFKKKDHVVAMTGDGVNDAPALQAADLGIGLGSGTQVAKDSSDIVLTDDDFGTIVDSIAEGRNIYLTLKKVILYLFSTNFGEVLVLAIAIFIGMPLPLVAVQIIWLNFVTDGFFVVALAQEPPEKGLISRTLVASDKLLDNLMVKRMLIMGAAMFVATIPIFYFFSQNYSVTYARSVALVILSVSQWFNAFNVRSRTLSVFKTPMNNPYLLVSLFIVFVLQLIAIETDLGNRLLHTESISLFHWMIAFGASTLIIWFEEIRKFFAKSE